MKMSVSTRSNETVCAIEAFLLSIKCTIAISTPPEYLRTACCLRDTHSLKLTMKRPTTPPRY
jgi:hypothetical protein